MIDLARLGDLVARHGRVARVVIAGHKGSAPREAGAAMLVWRDGQDGTIGGGRLEFDAAARARALLAGGPCAEVLRRALGPALGQCCGGAVTLVTEVWDKGLLKSAAAEAGSGVLARRVEGKAERPRAGQVAAALLKDGWLIEPVRRARLPVYIHGAGHVGRALADLLAPLDELAVHLCDPRGELFAGLPKCVMRHSGQPQETLMAAPDEAWHFIMTPDHGLDLELCHLLLGRRFDFAGLIGSGTKWARFRSRLRVLGHSEARISCIQCPIGDPTLGKAPQAIAIGVAAAILRRGTARIERAATEDVA